MARLEPGAPAGRFERACYRVGPRFHSWVYDVRCGVRGEWWPWMGGEWPWVTRARRRRG